MVLKKVALTGSTGLVGSHFLSLLEKKNIDYISSTRKNLDLFSDFQSKQLTSYFGKIDFFFHIAAAVPNSKIQINDDLMYKANVVATKKIATYCLENDTPMLFVSGAIVYKNPYKSKISENDEIGPEIFGGYYGKTKYLAEIELQKFISLGLKLIILRPSSIYGVGLDNNKFIPSLINKCREYKKIVLSPPVNERINLIHALDVAQSMLLAAESSALGIFNIAYINSYSILEIAETISNVIGPCTIEFNPSEENRSANERFSLDISKAKTNFGFSPKIDLNSGIKLCI